MLWHQLALYSTAHWLLIEIDINFSREERDDSELRADNEVICCYLSSIHSLQNIWNFFICDSFFSRFFIHLEHTKKLFNTKIIFFLFFFLSRDSRAAYYPTTMTDTHRMSEWMLCVVRSENGKTLKRERLAHKYYRNSYIIHARCCIFFSLSRSRSVFLFRIFLSLPFSSTIWNLCHFLSFFFCLLRFLWMWERGSDENKN